MPSIAHGCCHAIKHTITFIMKYCTKVREALPVVNWRLCISVDFNLRAISSIGDKPPLITQKPWITRNKPCYVGVACSALLIAAWVRDLRFQSTLFLSKLSLRVKSEGIQYQTLVTNLWWSGETSLTCAFLGWRSWSGTSNFNRHYFHQNYL